jgi:hypothetical protein
MGSPAVRATLNGWRNLQLSFDGTFGRNADNVFGRWALRNAIPQGGEISLGQSVGRWRATAPSGNEGIIIMDMRPSAVTEPRPRPNMAF